MAKRRHQRRPCAIGFGQLMYLAAALMHIPISFAQVESDVIKPANSAEANADQRALLLYLGEFDPEADPVELSQMSGAIAYGLEVKTNLDTTMEAGANAVDKPKN